MQMKDMKKSDHKITGVKWCGKLCHEFGMQRDITPGTSTVFKGEKVTAAKCQEACQESDLCEYWSFELATQNCTLLSGPGRLVAPSANDSYYISGPKLCERSRSESVTSLLCLLADINLQTNIHFLRGSTC